MKPFKTIFVFMLAFAGAGAFAETDSNGTGLFLEPGVSYQVTYSNVNYPGGVITSAPGSSASTNGFGLLLRGGVHVWDRFFVAADARYALLRFNDNANAIDVRANSWDVAPVIGMQMPESGPRLYLGYVLAGSLDPQSVNNRDIQFDGAQGWRVGAGLKVQNVSVNIEWQRLHYGNNKVTGTNSNDTGVTYNSEGLLASVTFPIDFK